MSEKYVETKLEFLLWKAVSLSITVIFSILIIIAAGLAISIEAKAEEIIHPTLPNSTIRDYSKPSIVFEGDEGYQTLPNTTIRDYSKPKYIRERHPVEIGTTITKITKITTITTNRSSLEIRASFAL